MNRDGGLEVSWEATDNFAYLGAEADRCATALEVPTLSHFLELRLQRLTPPVKPIAAVCDDPDPEKARVFDLVNQENRRHYHQSLIAYERQKQEAELLNAYPGTLAGYGAYLVRHHPPLPGFFAGRRSFRIPERSRRLHTYVTGGSGSGKSECLKALLWPYVAEPSPSCAVVLIDPHGDVARQVAQFAPHAVNGRLVYVDPAYDRRHCPCLNPFDCVPDKAALTDLDAEKLADEFLYAFAEILRGDLSDQMRTVLHATLPVLMKYPGSSIYDLIDFLELPEAKPRRKDGASADPAPGYKADKYKAFARAHYGNRLRVDFLFGQFEQDPSFRATRNSLQTRLNLIFGGLLMQTLFRGQRTVRLEDLVAARKFVVFNLSPELGTETADIIGRFLLINLKIFALNQAKVPEVRRVPCHAVVDECQRFITPSIEDLLCETRKFRLYLTLAQQLAGGGMGRELFAAVRANTGLKLTGANALDSLKVMADDTGTDLDDLKKLTIGRFSLWRRTIGKPLPAVTITMPTTTLGERASMTQAEWRRVMAEQLAAYYVLQTSETQEALPTQRMETPGEAFNPLSIDPLSIDISRHVS